MLTIWFRPHGTSGALQVSVNTQYAPHVWDLLAKEFMMLSEKP
jgi:hypothetical protein